MKRNPLRAGGKGFHSSFTADICAFQGFCQLCHFTCCTTIHLSPDSLADSLEQGDIQNGDHSEAAREGKEAKQKGSQVGSSTAGPSRGQDEGGDRSQHRIQVRVCLSPGVLIVSYQYILKGRHWNPAF